LPFLRTVSYRSSQSGSNGWKDLKEMHDRFGSAGFVAAYYAGPSRYEQHLVTGKPLPSETTAYVAAVTSLLDHEQVEHAAVDVRRALPWREAPLFVELASAP
jgi:hypothetical protein